MQVSIILHHEPDGSFSYYLRFSVFIPFVPALGRAQLPYKYDFNAELPQSL